MAQAIQVQRPSLDDFVAELTEAAYPVALRHKGDEAWLDLELDLWRALGKAVRKWGRLSAQTDGPRKRPPATLSSVIDLGHSRDARVSRFGE